MKSHAYTSCGQNANDILEQNAKLKKALSILQFSEQVAEQRTAQRCAEIVEGLTGHVAGKHYANAIRKEFNL